VEKLILILVIALLSLQTPYNSRATELLSSSITQSIPGGIITMEDIILNVTLDDANNKVVAVEIRTMENKVVHKENGCFYYACSDDLGHLPPATYITIVYTENGMLLSDLITIV
jgi:hypothetical protein